MAQTTLALADSVERETLVRLMNEAFSDYIIPMQLSQGAFDAMIERDDVLLAASYVAYRDDQPLGLALVAVRPERGGTRTRLASMGVVPDGRRGGVARTLLERAIADARARRSRQLVLEVFAANTPARHLYESQGFVRHRELTGFALPATVLRSRVVPPVALHPVAIPAVLPLFTACRAGEPAPAWQCDGPSLVRFQAPARAYTVSVAGRPDVCGYAVASIGETSMRLIHLGIMPPYRRHGLGTATLAALLAAHPGVEEIVVPQLIPDGSSLMPFFTACGAIRQPEQQIEMSLDLA